METTETKTEEKEKVYDIGTRTFIDKPEEGKPVDENKDKPLNQDKDKPADENKDKTVTTNPPKFEIGSFLKEKYNLDEEGLTTTLNRVKDLEEQVKNPKFDNETDQKAYQFLKTFPPSMMGEGLRTYGKLIDMEPSKISDKEALQEEFVLSKPNLSRSESERLFESKWKRDYVLDREKFDTDEAFKEAQQLAEIELKDKASDAKTKLSAKQAELKAKVTEKPKDTGVREEPKAPEHSVKTYSGQVDSFLKSADTITMKDDKDEKLSYNIKLAPEVMKNVNDAMKEYVQRPDIYDKDGKIPNFNPQELYEQMLFLTMGAKAYNKMHFDKITELSRTLTAEQIAGTKPDKESKGNADSVPKTWEESIKQAADKAVQERNKG